MIVQGAAPESPLRQPAPCTPTLPTKLFKVMQESPIRATIKFSNDRMGAMDMYLYLAIGMLILAVAAYAITKKEWISNMLIGGAFLVAALKYINAAAESLLIILWLFSAGLCFLWALWNFKRLNKTLVKTTKRKTKRA